MQKLSNELYNVFIRPTLIPIATVAVIAAAIVIAKVIS